MKQKKSYKSVPAAAVVKEYRRHLDPPHPDCPGRRLPYLAGHLRTDNPCKRHL